MRSLISIDAVNFLSLGYVNVELKDLTVLVGPNGAGKSNLLKVIQFLGDTARLDLLPAIEKHGGFQQLLFRGQEARSPKKIKLGIKALITNHSSQTAPDEYSLSIWQRARNSGPRSSFEIIQRQEDFVFKRTEGRGRRITVSGSKVELNALGDAKKPGSSTPTLSPTSSGLSTLPRLRGTNADQINSLAELFTTFRVFEIDGVKARLAARFDPSKAPVLDSDAGNLAAFLQWLKSEHSDVFDLLEEDLMVIVPSITKIVFERLSGADNSTFAVSFAERGLVGRTRLADASFGTVRALALLAMLHDPKPPKLTCVEEIDHGLHPHALDRIVERMRSASSRTQLLVVTHSPALANRLEPDELVVCERDLETGGSRIPAITSSQVAAMAEASGLLPGELWFSGALGGGL